jgi:hypothetical protein
MRKTQCVLFLTIVAACSAVAADDTPARLGRAVAVLNAMTELRTGFSRHRLLAPTASLLFLDSKRAPRLSALATGGDSFPAGPAAAGRRQDRSH